MAIGDTINTATLTQTLDDEFNIFTSSAVGSTRLWRTSYSNGVRILNGEREYYTDSSVGVNPFSLNNGVLTINATAAALGSNPVNLPYNSGIITTLYFFVHSAVQATEGTVLTVSHVSTGYNLYGVIWGPQSVSLYINNIEVATVATPADMNVPM